jgi:competence protein ComEC
LRQEIGDALPFWDRDLDMLIVTQPKSSVINALPALLDRYDVGLVLTNGQTAESDEYRALVRAWGSKQMSVAAGYHLETDDGVTLEILHPQALPDAEADPDQEALVLRVSYGETSFLITPELDASAEKELLEAGWYAGSTVLVLPAHGSDKANPDWFLQAVHPQAAVAMVEAGNRTELPASGTLDRLQTLSAGPVYRTDQQGTVEMVTDGRTLWVYPER